VLLNFPNLPHVSINEPQMQRWLCPILKHNLYTYFLNIIIFTFISNIYYIYLMFNLYYIFLLAGLASFFCANQERDFNSYLTFLHGAVSSTHFYPSLLRVLAIR